MGTTWRSDPAPADRRSAARRQATLGTVCRLTSADGADLGTGLVWNLSTQGVSLLLGQPLERGSVALGALIRDEGQAIERGLRVVHVTPLAAGDYALGCQFDHALTADEMNPFLA